MGRSRTVSDTQTVVSVEISQIFYPRAFSAHVEWVPVPLWIFNGGGSKNGDARWSRKFDDIYFRSDTIPQRHRQTDGRTDG